MPGHHHVDADFAEEILAELYAYPHRRRWLAFLLWGTLGWFGAHRFYLDRSGTGLLMLFSLGGGLVWWVADGFLIRGMVRDFNAEQDRRRVDGLPPVELSFMPPLQRDVLAQPPEWTHRWHSASRRRRATRLVGDVLVLTFIGVGLGSVAKAAGVWEAVLAVLVLVLITAAGSHVGRLGQVPIVHGLIRWSHRLRLFYYYNRPGSPIALLFRPITGAMFAPFRRRDRAEVKLYLQLGAVFTLAFLLFDFGADVIGPILSGRMPGFGDVFALWISEAAVTFVVTYAFATPIGAVLTLYLLVSRSHTTPRVLSAVVLCAVLLGLVA